MAGSQRHARLRQVDTRQRQKLRRRAFDSLQGALYWCGSTRVFRRWQRSPSAAILMYHSVAARETSPWIDPCQAMSAERFQRQMEFLATCRNVISIAELLDALQNQLDVPPGTVALTFDDGYRDQLDVAAPILVRYGLPATFYLITHNVDCGDRPWNDRLYAMFRTRSRDQLQVREVADRRWDLRNLAECRDAYAALAEHLLLASPDRRAEIFKVVGDELLPSGDIPRVSMCWDEVRALAKMSPRFDIGAHSVNHLDLATYSAHAQWEISQSAERIAAQLGRDVIHFAFPYNRSNSQSRRAVAACGMASGVTDGYPQMVVRDDADPYALPRFAAPSSLTQLAYWTSGAYPDLPRSLFGRA